MQTHMLHLAIFQPAHLTVQCAFPLILCTVFVIIWGSSTTFLCFPLLYNVCTYRIQFIFVLNYLSYYHLNAVQVIMFPILHAWISEVSLWMLSWPFGKKLTSSFAGLCSSQAFTLQWFVCSMAGQEPWCGAELQLLASQTNNMKSYLYSTSEVLQDQTNGLNCTLFKYMII